MPEVLLSNDDITVLGPPEIVEVLVDIGPQGIRGSKVFVGSGDPNSLTVDGEILSQTIQFQDLYINVSPGADYAYMYQYVEGTGGNIWKKTLQISPAIYSNNYSPSFTASGSVGNGTITIPITDITTVTGLTASSFNVQYEVAHTNPVASSMQVSVSSGNLVIAIGASQFSGGTWSALTGTITVHVFVSII